MKTKHKLTLLLLLSISLLKADYWTQKASFQNMICGSVGFSIGNTGYLGTGLFNTALTNIFRAYNPATNSWLPKAFFAGTARLRGTGIAIDSLGYIGLGIGTNNDLQDWWQYNPATNTWTQKADFGGGQTRDAAGFSIGSFGYIATGGINYSNQFWRYDPASNTWMQMTNFGGAGRQLAIGFGAGGKGYVGTGFNGTDLKDFWEYDPVNNSWSQKASLAGSERWAATGFSIGTKGYIGMGIHNLTVLQDFWEYNTATNQWSQKADYGAGAMYYTAQFAIGNKGYVGTGMDAGNNLTGSFWEYTPGNTSGISDFEFRISDFTIAPNPVKDYCELRILNCVLKSKIEILITNVLGIKVYETQTEIRPALIQSGNSKSQIIKIPLIDLRAGIYFVEINNGKENAVKKFLKE